MTEKKPWEDMTDQEKIAAKADKVYHDKDGKAYKTGSKGKPIRVPEKDIVPKEPEPEPEDEDQEDLDFDSEEN